MAKLIRIVLSLFPRPLLIRLSYGFTPVFTLLFKGVRYTDPIDNRSFWTFLPYGYHKSRKNALSPSTLSLERHRLLWLYLKRETGFFTAPLKVLHIAPEQAFVRRFRKLENLDYLTADLLSPLADVKADVCDLPFESNRFDVVFCNHVLEHVDDDLKAMKELMRVMKPGGWGIFQIPIDQQRQQTLRDDSITDRKERSRIFGQYDHLRVYGMDYFSTLESVGFEVKKIDYTVQIEESELTKYGLIAGDLIPLVRKP